MRNDVLILIGLFILFDILLLLGSFGLERNNEEREEEILKRFAEKQKTDKEEPSEKR